MLGSSEEQADGPGSLFPHISPDSKQLFIREEGDPSAEALLWVLTGTFPKTIPSVGLPLGRTGGLRTKGLVDKLVSTIAAVTLSMSSSSDDFL